MFDGIPYKLVHVQKSSPTLSEDFLFVEIYKFFTNKNVKYIVRAEMHKENVFAVKYYASFQRKLDHKYQMLTVKGDAHKVILTCSMLLPILLSKYPTASFALNGSRTISPANNKVERMSNNQRFRIYSFFIDLKIGRQTFEHYVFEEVSSYLLVNKKTNEPTNIKKKKIMDMFLSTYFFNLDI